MGCVSGKRDDASLAENDKLNRGRLSGYKQANQTLMDVKDFQFVPFDSRLPLTKRQIFSLIQSWRGIRRDMATIGTELIVELLHSDPAVRRVFTKFADTTSKQAMRSSEKVEEHGHKVMSVLDNVVIHLDEYENVSNMINKIGASHVKWIGEQPELFMMVKQPFLRSVQLSFGDRYTDNIHNVYEILIDFLIAELIKAVKAAQEQTQPTV